MCSAMHTKYATPGEQRVDCVEQRRDKEKRKLDRFGDAGEKRRQRRGNHDAADLGAIFAYVPRATSRMPLPAVPTF